ncbi:uncharacterized protein Z518_04001 [Rhinocladiella mackenziei CBS 650.93]|uniref:DUF1996 domain-containing protein n=1 Tax=Rhinocladiella mackenziei CBS 650.93 TaxID=1442369 RepID=A0A0D2FVB7_9EURO|nr:uncharacterized protein Z518_04001 [Rhinocladiella mackenziei CBS 650.93]KIX06027.1 hypothetical protein Z518_04001 [Rhinocladiella mackenziei CBS 650.93]
MACSVSQTSRIDPIRNPGGVSGHVHKLAGGNNVNENADFNSLQSSTCSSCEIQKDTSAYWTPQLYYAHANGSFEEVPNYGMTVYYVGRGGNSSNTTPFPPGFKMVTGDSRQRSFDNTTLTYLNTRPVADRVSFRCIDEANDIPEEHYMFRTDCVNGMRAQINFPSCWDGVNLYLDNSAHVEYLSGIDHGVCPPSHPVPIPGLFFEVLYMTNLVDQSGGGQFVFSNGDPTGYGFHGDFINGWDVDVQTDAVQNCLYTDDGGVISACPYLAPSDDVNFARTCPEQPSVFDEPVHGMIAALPGCNPITYGPDPAPQVDCPLNVNDPNASNTASVSSSTSVTPSSMASSTTAVVSAIGSSPMISSSTIPNFTPRSSTSAAPTTPTTSSTKSGADTITSSDFISTPTFSSISSFDETTTAISFTPTSNFPAVMSTIQDASRSFTSPGPNQTLGGGFVQLPTSDGIAASSTGLDTASTLTLETASETFTSTGDPLRTAQPNSVSTITSDASVVPSQLSGLTTMTITTTGWVPVTVTVGNHASANFVTTSNLGRSGNIFTITGSTYTTFSPADEPSMTDEATSTTIMHITTTLHVVAAPASTRPITPQSTSYANTAFTTMTSTASGDSTSSPLVSSAFSVDDTFACSLYSAFSIEGCPSPATTSSITAAADSVATTFVTVTEPITDETTSTVQTILTLSSARANTTFLRIRGREVHFAGR